MPIADDYEAIGKRLREIAGESWYPVRKDGPKTRTGRLPCEFCGAEYDPQTGGYPDCGGMCF